MSYEKQTWQTGDVVTSAKLNHMEDGIAGGGALAVNATDVGGTLTCDKTAGEMWAAINNGQNIIISIADAVAWPVIYADDGFNFQAWSGDAPLAFSAATADDYPSASFS